MITVNRATNHFGDHVIGRAEPDRTEPEKKEIICVPPAHRRLQHSLHRHDEEHQLASRVEPWKPEKRAQQIPLRKDRKSTRLNSSHRCISYAVFCLKKKKKKNTFARH